MSIVTDFLVELWQITVDMSFYLLLGFLFAGILKVWFPKRWINKYMGKNNFMSVFNTALLGVPLPLCSCGVIPTGVSFYRNGASKGASVSFLIATPQTGVDSVLVTYSLLGLPFAIIRVFVALITGIVGGLVTNFVDAGHSDQNEDAKEQGANNKKDRNPILHLFRYGFFEFLMDIAKWLIIGLLIAAALAVVIPDNFFTLYLNNEWLSMLVVLVASVPMYICATASVPIAAVLLLKGLSPGAALVLLMAGPATNAATITVLKKVFGGKTLAAYLFSIIGGALFFGYIVNNFLPREWFELSHHAMHQGHQHEVLPYWMQVSSAILLIGLIINGFYWRWRTKVIQSKVKVSSNVKQSNSVLMTSNNVTPTFTAPSFVFPITTNRLIIEVKGMTCNHCKNSVETNVGKLKGVERVTANPSTNSVIIEGNGYDLNTIRTVINQLGYQYLGEKS